MKHLDANAIARQDGIEVLRDIIDLAPSRKTKLLGSGAEIIRAFMSSSGVSFVTLARPREWPTPSGAFTPT